MLRKFILIPVVIIAILLLVKHHNMTWRQSILKAAYPLIMLKGKLLGDRADILTDSKTIPTVSFYSLKATDNKGHVFDFDSLKGRKVLLVNTASNCGFTGQYDELQRLHVQYGDRLVILGFPANDFKAQEPGTDAEIAEFCRLNYGVSFPLMQKSQVIKGADQNPVFYWLTHAEANGWCIQAPKWNFNKYIVNETGQLVAYASQDVSPLSEDFQKWLK
jgi:glutathione peroxidase